MATQGVVKGAGDSAPVRIPAFVPKAANLRLDHAMDVREDGARPWLRLEICSALLDWTGWTMAIRRETYHGSPCYR